MTTAPMSLDERSLVLCSGTLLAFGLRDLVAAAAAGGFDAITLWPSDLAEARDAGLADVDIRALLDDHGLVVADLDPLLTWSPLVTPKPGQAAVPLAEEAEFYAIAEALGARSLNLTQGFGAELDLDRAAEDLAAVCDRAREHGLLVTYEFLPWTGVPDAETALALCERTGRANATVLVDTWHWYRGGGDLAMLRALPGARVGSVQLSDAPAVPDPPDLPPLGETMRARRMPGDGDVPMVEVVRTLDAIGSRAPLGVEVFRGDHASMDPLEIGRRAGRAAREVVAQART